MQFENEKRRQEEILMKKDEEIRQLRAAAVKITQDYCKNWKATKEGMLWKIEATPPYTHTED